MHGFIPDEVLNRPRQEIPNYYRINGALYIVNANILNEKNFLYNDRCYAYIMKKKNSIDIDDELDFQMVQIMMNSLN